MAAGILSVGLHLTGHEVVSLVALAIAAALWLVLAVDFASRLLADRGRFRADADTPGALTAVAATTVLGTRISLLGWQTAAAALLALAAVIWPELLLHVVRHWRRRMPGAVFLGCVATQGLAVLAATLAAAGRHDWLAWAALAAFCLGLLLYVAALALFDLREVVGGAGDHWVAGGALAISALAGSKLTASPVWTAGAHTALRIVTLVTLGLSLVWYAVLLGAELTPSPDALRHPALGHRLPARHDGDRLPLRGGAGRRALAAPARRGPPLDRRRSLAADLRVVPRLPPGRARRATGRPTGDDDRMTRPRPGPARPLLWRRPGPLSRVPPWHTRSR